MARPDCWSIRLSKDPPCGAFPGFCFHARSKDSEMRTWKSELVRESEIRHHWWGSWLPVDSHVINWGWMSYRGSLSVRVCVYIASTYQRSSLRQTCKLDVAQVVHFFQSPLFEVADRRGVWTVTPDVCRSPLLIISLCFVLLFGSRDGFWSGKGSERNETTCFVFPSPTSFQNPYRGPIDGPSKGGHRWEMRQMLRMNHVGTANLDHSFWTSPVVAARSYPVVTIPKECIALEQMMGSST